MNENYKYDDTFMNILREEGQIIPFLDAIFGFLHRRSDFYIVNRNEGGKVGFPPGYAEEAVRGTFRKWQNLSSLAHQGDPTLSSKKEDLFDLVIHEEEVVTTDTSCHQTKECIEQTTLKEQDREDDLSSDIYNGADCGHYRWSQTGFEVDIKIPVPSNVTKSSCVSVDVQSSQLRVNVCDSDGQWSTQVEGQFAHKHLKDESIWTLLPGKHINVHLQKSEEKWWDRLLTTEAELDMNRLDMSRHLTDLPDEDKMQVEKVMIQEDRKRLGLPTLDHQHNLDTLMNAWDQEGSPFKGTPFDPSVLQPP